MKKFILALLFTSLSPLAASNNDFETYDPVSSLASLQNDLLTTGEDIGCDRIQFTVNQQVCFIPKKDYYFLLSEEGKRDLTFEDFSLNHVEQDTSEKNFLKLRFFYDVTYSSTYIQRDAPAKKVKVTVFFKKKKGF